MHIINEFASAGQLRDGCADLLHKLMTAPQRVCALLTALALLATPSLAQVLRQDPAPGSLGKLEKVLVNDGSCPQGQIKEVTGGDSSKGIGRTSRCIPLSKDTAAALDRPDAALTPEVLKAGLDLIRSRHGYTTGWFRYEEPGQAAIDVTAGAPVADSAVGLGSISKTVTAIGIALLIQQGKLSLDSRIGDVLAGYFAQRKTALDPSLKSVTIERLLTHRAGLAAQGTGIGPALPERLQASHFFSYYTVMAAIGQAKSNGKDDFVYSNFSYLFLGMVIEAVSGQSYAEFCQRNIFGPLGIKGANIPSYWNLVAPLGGWRLELAGVLKMFSVFDIEHPTLLSEATLKATLLGKLGRPISEGSNVYYTLGVYVRQDRDGGPYVVNHDGVARFFKNIPMGYYMYVEKYVPGYAWAIAAAPTTPVGKPISSGVPSDVRRMLIGQLK
jgi:CubicO group peptidase (beta-lactamase class C family)